MAFPNILTEAVNTSEITLNQVVPTANSAEELNMVMQYSAKRKELLTLILHVLNLYILR